MRWPMRQTCSKSLMPEIKTRRGVFMVSDRAAREVEATKRRKRYRIPPSWWDEDVAVNMAAYIKRANEEIPGS